MGAARFIRSLDKPDARVPSPVVLVPLAGVVGSEALLFFGYTYPSLYLHVATLLVATLGPLRFREHATLFRAFALVPLFRLVNLGMPVFFELTVQWFPLVYGPLIPALFLLGGQGESPDLEMGWRTTALGLPVAIPLAWVLAEVEYQIIRPAALVPSTSLENLLLISVVMFLFVGLVEELLFRGLFQRTLEWEFGRIPGLVLASAVFGLMHSGYGVPAELVFAGSIGLIFGILYELTDSIGLITVIHGALNVFLFAVIPIQGAIIAPALG